jgi:hypothetical protein
MAKVEVTLESLADAIVPDVDAAVAAWLKAGEESAKRVIEEAQSEWPTLTGKSRDGLRVKSGRDGSTLKITMYSTEAYGYMVRFAWVGSGKYRHRGWVAPDPRARPMEPDPTRPGKNAWATLVRPRLDEVAFDAQRAFSEAWRRGGN